MDVGERESEPPGAAGENGVGRGRARPHAPPELFFELSDPGSFLGGAQRSALCALVDRALARTHAAGSVHARVVNDAQMAEAHQRYSGIPGTTDVLTFDLSGNRPAGIGPRQDLDVEVLICVDEARRQAASRGLPVEQELVLYILHGVLHCLGFDDHDPAAASAMHAEEDRILEVAGIGRTFAAAERSDAERAKAGRVVA